MNGKEKPKSQKPLLYIEQPNFKEPKFRMQSHFQSSPDITAAPNVSEDVDVDRERAKTRKRNVNYIEEEEFIYEKQKAEEQQIEEKEPVSASDYFRFHAHKNRPTKGGLRPVKSFTAMTIEEKLHHLSSKSQFYSCSFSTQTRRIIGKLHENHNEHIVVKADSGEHVTIGKKELTGIRINI